MKPIKANIEGIKVNFISPLAALLHKAASFFIVYLKSIRIAENWFTESFYNKKKPICILQH